MLSNLRFNSESKHSRDPGRIRLLKCRSWVPSRWLFGPPLIFCLARRDSFQFQDIRGAGLRVVANGALSGIFKEKSSLPTATYVLYTVC
jgi:hypothetical protein